MIVQLSFLGKLFLKEILGFAGFILYVEASVCILAS